MRKVLTALLWTGVLLSFSSVAWEKPGFPRLGGYQIGSPQKYEDPTYQEQLARLDLIIINNFPGWEAAHGTAMRSVVRAIKSRNPSVLVFEYVNLNEAPAEPRQAWSQVQQKLDTEHWWLYTQGTSGTPVASTWAKYAITNYSLAVPPNRDGQRYADWYPRWAYQQFFASTPEIDGAFTDNMFWKPRVDGDWNRDGQVDKKGSALAQSLHRQGMRHHIEVLRSLMPGKYQLGNVGGWGDPEAVYPEYEGLLQGGVLENYIGKSWSPEGLDWQGTANSWGSWQQLMTRYRKVMRSIAEPKLIIFNQLGDPNDYQAMRYGLASCMMDDGYYQFADATAYSSVPWFDEFDVELGMATSAPPAGAWKSGVYRRNFEHGVVLVNPRGNGAVTVDLEKDFKRITGTQDRAVNNGQLTRKVTLKDRDGIILLDPNATDLPQPPKNFEAR